MRTKNEITISNAEWGSTAVNAEGKFVILKPGLISLNCHLLEQGIITSGAERDFDKSAPTELRLLHPITVPAILFGRPQFVTLLPIATDPVKELIFRKEAYLEDEKGDILECEYVKMHTDGKPIFRNIRLDNESGSEKDTHGDSNKKSKRVDSSTNRVRRDN
jgi:hypothetical protein